MANLARILSLEVPIVVVLGQRGMRLGEVMALIPGAIVELPKTASDELELLVNNKVLGTGVAVKVGENFGLRLTHIGSAREKISALGGDAAATADADAPGATQAAPGGDAGGDMDFEALAAQMLAGQA